MHFLKTITGRAALRSVGGTVGATIPVTLNSDHPDRLLKLFSTDWDRFAAGAGEYITVFAEAPEISATSGLVLGLMAPRLFSIGKRARSLGAQTTATLTARAAASALLAIPVGLVAGTLLNRDLAQGDHFAAKDAYDYEELVDAFDMDGASFPAHDATWGEWWDAVTMDNIALISPLDGIRETMNQMGYTTLDTFSEYLNDGITLLSGDFVMGIAPAIVSVAVMIGVYSLIVGDIPKSNRPPETYSA